MAPTNEASTGSSLFKQFSLWFWAAFGRMAGFLLVGIFLTRPKLAFCFARPLTVHDDRRRLPSVLFSPRLSRQSRIGNLPTVCRGTKRWANRLVGLGFIGLIRMDLIPLSCHKGFHNVEPSLPHEHWQGRGSGSVGDASVAVDTTPHQNQIVAAWPLRPPAAV